MRYSTRLKKLDTSDCKRAILEFDSEVNTERLLTMYEGDISNISAEVIFRDPRSFNARQRRFYYALLGDIYKHYGQAVEQLDEWFKQEYIIKYSDLISLSDDSKTTVSEANQLLAIVVDFIMSNNIPLNGGYSLIDRQEGYYLYSCAKHRKCVVCGSHADIHHIDAVGNRKRSKVDHRELRLIAVCRKHHDEAHRLGNTNFMNKYKVHGIKLDGDALVKLNIMTIKRIGEIDDEKI